MPEFLAAASALSGRACVRGLDGLGQPVERRSKRLVDGEADRVEVLRGAVKAFELGGGPSTRSTVSSSRPGSMGEDGLMVLPADGPAPGWGMPAAGRRQEEVRRLLALMGGSIAALYEDACRLLLAEPPLATASHVVGHLAREIESGLRELLTAMVPADRMAALERLPRDPGQRRPPWKAVVDEICTALDFAPGDEVRSLWRSVLWAPRAHRGALLRPRPVDERFRSAWRDFEVLLLRVGRQYEATYAAALPVVDELAAIDSPSGEDLSRLRHQVPHGVVALRRFFERASAGWFTRLREAGYLSDPPGLQPTEDGLVVYTPWPAGRYLVRMAQVPSLTDAVVGVALGLDTDNPEACECVAEAALALPAEAAARLAPRLAAFLAQPLVWALPVKAGEVVVALAAAGQVEAALTVLGPLLPTDARPGPGRKYFPREVFTRAFPHLGLPGLGLLADRLDSLVADDPTERPALLHSFMWRPAIEIDHYGDGPGCARFCAVRRRGRRGHGGGRRRGSRVARPPRTRPVRPAASARAGPGPRPGLGRRAADLT